ncbi:ABC transporter ATP-binding protein [Falsiroseomonas ponticola]|uniref:ABC transporter ATP-binding protein n=1 Tax=Falsiroseomonas ponticola TaxID=2786951 RepID=UPI0019330BBE|nr:ABC transporter ATP-binding protein [Roseomonas ponticola]
MSVLEVAGLRIAASAREVVRDLSFTVAEGETLALVGESGSGKSATARAVIGLLPPGLRQSGGRIAFTGQDLSALSPAKLRALRGPGMGMVFQEPMTSLNPAQRIGAQMAEGLALHTGLSAPERRRACIAMLERVGISDPERRLQAFPHEFSGGMRQRIMLASVMLLRPRLLIADEPTTALDTLTQAEVLSLMKELAREQGSAVLLITHDLGLVSRHADRALVMQAGQAVEEGPAAPLLAAPRQPYTQALVAALPRRGPSRALPPAAPLIEARELSVAYPGRGGWFTRAAPMQAVRGVSLSIHPGEVVALVGGSGSGKTTLGRAMLRLLPVSGGALLFRGEEVTARTGAGLLDFRLACQIVFQDPYSSLDPRMRVRDIVAEPLRLPAGMPVPERHRRAEAMLAEVGLGGLGDRYPHALSGGQRQRVAIARALVRNPAFVVADEAVSALDATVRKQVIALLRDQQRKRGFACLFVTHDLGVVEEIADRIVVMQSGRIVEEGARDQVLDAPAHAYTRALLEASLRLPATA